MFWNVSCMHSLRADHGWHSWPMLTLISNEIKQFDLVRLVWLKICCPPGSVPKDHALVECCIQGILPEPHLQRTHTHTLESHTLTQKNTKKIKEDKKHWNCLGDTATLRLPTICWGMSKITSWLHCAGHGVQWYAVGMPWHAVLSWNNVKHRNDGVRSN